MRKPVITYAQAQQIIDFNGEHCVTNTDFKPVGSALVVATLTLFAIVLAVLHYAA